MENAKITKEEKARIAEQKRIEKELIYDGSHFYLKETDENGKVIKTPLAGCYTDNSIVFTFDGNGYIVVVDDTHNGTFVNAYPRCKETSKMYGIKSQLVKLTKSYCSGLVDVVKCGMTYSDMYAKAQNCRGYKPATVKRVIEVSELCNSKARTVAAKKSKAEERAKARQTEDKSVA